MTLYDQNPTGFPALGLATPRLLLLAAHPDHADAMRTFLQQNRQHLEPWEPQRDAAYFTHDAVVQRLQDMAQRTASGSALHLLVMNGESGALVGACNATHIVRGVFQACHLGFALAEDAQGQGLMQEALARMTDYLFDGMGLHRIMANYRPNNVRSAQLLSRLGFEREGLARSYLKINGVWADHVLTSRVNPRD